MKSFLEEWKIVLYSEKLVLKCEIFKFNVCDFEDQRVIAIIDWTKKTKIQLKEVFTKF